MIWTARLDRKILSGVAAGLSTREIAKQIGNGCTRNMVIGRHKRLRGIISPCEARRNELSAAQQTLRDQEYAERLAAALTEFDRRIRAGEPRNWVIESVRRRGLSCREIGDHVGLSHERIRQICEMQS